MKWFLVLLTLLNLLLAACGDTSTPTFGAVGIDGTIWILIKAVFSGYQVIEIRQ